MILSNFLFNGLFLFLQKIISGGGGTFYILQEDGFYLLQEDNSKLILEV
jgi:hypothetical protein